MTFVFTLSMKTSIGTILPIVLYNLPPLELEVAASLSSEAVIQNHPRLYFLCRIGTFCADATSCAKPKLGTTHPEFFHTKTINMP